MFLPRSDHLHRASLLAAALLLALPAAAQESATGSAPLPTGMASLEFEGRQVGKVAFSIAPDGPRFALPPIAAALGVELRIGPLGDSHTLIFEKQKVVVGPDQKLMIQVDADGRRQEDLTRLSRAPIKDLLGLKVPLELLDHTFGEQLSLRFEWRAEVLELAVARRELRELGAALNVVHQHRLSVVELELSETPRYRVERLPGALEIRLLGDRLRLPLERDGRSPDPLISGIVVAPAGVRIELAEGAAAAEPRLLSRPVPRLVVEVFRQAAAPEEPEPGSRAAEPKRSGIRTIALDPGHGGSESGAIGASGTSESDLTLLVGRALKRQIERRLPVRVIMTRSQNVDLPLETRTAIANQNKADLFISLHFNSSFGAKAHGAETFFLSREASDQLAAAAAEEENQMSGGDESAAEFDLQLILWDLAQSYHLAESQRFANLVQEELNLTLGLRNRGVKQAPFRVLMGAQMPAVLVELGFLSNPAEEAKLQSPVYRAELVDSLVRAVIRFKTQLEAREVATDAADERSP